MVANPVKPVVNTYGSGAYRSTDVADSNMDACQSACYRHAGITLAGNGFAPLAAEWCPDLMLGAAALASSARQQAAGQHRLACVVYPEGRNDEPVSEQERYHTLIRNALFTGQESNRTGVCVPGTDLSGGDQGLVGCGTGHQGEIFGLGAAADGHPVARAALQRTCLSAVTRRGIPDVAAVGLTVGVLATGMKDAPIAGATINADASLTC